MIHVPRGFRVTRALIISIIQMSIYNNELKGTLE